MPLNIPILTYHSLHARDVHYSGNDHVALEQDLEVVHAHGFRVVSLRKIAEHLVYGTHPELERNRVIGISFDDGCELDFVDFHHPQAPSVKSFDRIIRESHVRSLYPPGEDSLYTSFVIASPDARDVLDRTCIAGRGQWGDDWWDAAIKSGRCEIANHSWDHLHPELVSVAHSRGEKGSFAAVDNRADADLQLVQAADFIRSRLGDDRPQLFAYPFGHSSPFLVNEYFGELTDYFFAAFATSGEPVTSHSNRWLIPRLVCGDHWKSSEDLGRILAASASESPDSVDL